MRSAVENHGQISDLLPRPYIWCSWLVFCEEEEEDEEDEEEEEEVPPPPPPLLLLLLPARFSLHLGVLLQLATMASSSDQYDEGGSTFYFFLLTFLTLYLVPATINRLRACAFRSGAARAILPAKKPG